MENGALDVQPDSQVNLDEEILKPAYGVTKRNAGHRKLKRKFFNLKLKFLN